jgi:hypothetical protein
LTIAKSFIYGVAALVFTGLYPQTALGEGFKNKDFLKLENNEKKYWLLASIETLWQVEALKNKKTAQCIADWYYKDVANKNALLLASMRKYPNYAPIAILVALTEKSCGNYARKHLD